MLERLVKLADHLDREGLLSDADQVDQLVKNAISATRVKDIADTVKKAYQAYSILRDKLKQITSNTNPDELIALFEELDRIDIDNILKTLVPATRESSFDGLTKQASAIAFVVTIVRFANALYGGIKQAREILDKIRENKQSLKRMLFKIKKKKDVKTTQERITDFTSKLAKDIAKLYTKSKVDGLLPDFVDAMKNLKDYFSPKGSDHSKY